MNKQITLVAITAAILTAGAILSVSMVAHTVAAQALIVTPPSTLNANGGDSLAGGGRSGPGGNGGSNSDCDASCSANGGTSQANGGVSSAAGAGGINTECDNHICSANGGLSFAGGGSAGTGGTGGNNTGS